VRHLEWDGCFNVRDLGGLPTLGGDRTRFGAVVRADALDGLTQRGWSALVDHGVRTIVDLRNEDEQRADVVARPRAVCTLRLPLDRQSDRDFWAVWRNGPQFGTPLYYAPHLSRFPRLSAAVVAAIADAPPGGVVFHCGGGRDRAGQIAMLVLALVGVDPKLIAEDYELSFERLPARYAAHQEADQGQALRSYLTERGTTPSEAVIDTLARIDVEQTLRRGGLYDTQLRSLRDRLLDADTPL